jgi:hypothetical protein
MKTLRTTGVLRGLRIPESARGKFVLIAGGSIVDVGASPRSVVARARRLKGTPLLLSIPKDDKVIAAY